MKKVSGKNKLNQAQIRKSSLTFEETYQRIQEIYPNAHCALNHRNPLELLIATILSAQCTDKRVNMVTPGLFKKYPDARAFANADLLDLQEIIRSTGFYRNKAKNILACCKTLVNEFKGEVPDKMEDLLKLAGVARKTANVVLWNAFGKNEGVVVDTHVGRISQRLGWTGNSAPEKIEKDLMKLAPREKWGHLSHLLIDLGRDVCKSPTPNCKSCGIVDICPWFKFVLSPKSKKNNN